MQRKRVILDEQCAQLNTKLIIQVIKKNDKLINYFKN